jgi:hypothetical protein
MTRTYSRDDWFQAKEAWRDFGWEWQELRRLAADRGMIYPPTGTRHDDRDAENPTQRAIVWRALQDNPAELRKLILRCRSWNGVVAGIIGLESRLRLDADDLERDEAWDKAHHPDHREAARSIADILRRIGDSAA